MCQNTSVPKDLVRGTTSENIKPSQCTLHPKMDMTCHFQRGKGHVFVSGMLVGSH